jgi:hypothetical protein
MAIKTLPGYKGAGTKGYYTELTEEQKKQLEGTYKKAEPTQLTPYTPQSLNETALPPGYVGDGNGIQKVATNDIQKLPTAVQVANAGLQQGKNRSDSYPDVSPVSSAVAPTTTPTTTPTTSDIASAVQSRIVGATQKNGTSNITTITPTSAIDNLTTTPPEKYVEAVKEAEQKAAEAEAKAQKEAEFKNDILATLKQLTNTLTPSEEKQKATLATQEQIRQNLANIMAMGQKNNTQIGNLVTDSSNMIKDAYGETKKLAGSTHDYILSNPYESDIGKSIMNFYNMQGGKGASEATAEAAATNAGNIDSYSAANANRQRLAFTNAGTEAIRNQYNATTANLLNTLQQFGINVGDLIAKFNENVKNQQAYNAELMGQYTEGAKTETNAITEAEKNRLALKSDIANYISQLLGTKSSNETQKEIAKIDADTQKYLGDINVDAALHGQADTQSATPKTVYKAFQDMLAGNYTDEDGKTIAPADANEAIAILLELFPGNKDYINTYIKPLAN